MRRPRIGIDSYSLTPLDLSPLGILRWALENGARGVQFSGVPGRERARLDRGALTELRDFARDNDLYLEWGGGSHIPFDMKTWRSVDLFEINRSAAEEAHCLGAGVIRSCSGGLMRWNPEAPSTEEFIAATADALRGVCGMLTDYGVVLAIETHFEFTTFELLRLFEKSGAEPGGPLGICLDTMNLLTMLEEPLSGTDRILPWVVATHIKDGGIFWDSAGLTSFPAEIGIGVIDLETIVGRIAGLPREVTLSIEDHGGSFALPVFDPAFLRGFPDLTLGEFVDLARLADRTKEKIDSGALQVVNRDLWPSVCEERVRRDIAALRTLTES